MRARRYRVLRAGLIASRLDERRSRLDQGCIRGRPGMLAATCGDDTASVVASCGRRGWPGPLRQCSGRPGRHVPPAARRPVGVFGAQHTRIVSASARLACPRQKMGWAGVGALRCRSRGACRRADRAGRRRARGGALRGSATVLHQAADLLTESAPARLPVRLAWVSAELAMARSDGRTAVRHAQRAVDLAAGLGSVRQPSNRTSSWPRRYAAQANSVGAPRRRPRHGHLPTIGNGSAVLGAGVPAG